MTQPKFAIDVEKCTGCSLCIVACKDEYVDKSYNPWSKPQPEGDHFWIKIESLERGEIPRVKVQHLPIMCQHCEDAPCVTACPEAAIKTRGDGMVWIDPELCTGCGDCQPACPYDVIYKNEELNIAQKCNGCAHRLDNQELPRCVDICPHEAITYGQLNETNNFQEILHPEYLTRPRVLWRDLPKPWITGLIVDVIEEEVIAGASVKATNLINGEKTETISNEFGEFWLTKVELNNNYRVEISGAGYRKFRTTFSLEAEKDIGTIELQTDL